MSVCKGISLAAAISAALAGAAEAQTPRAADQTLGAALMSAMVGSDGTLIRGAGATASGRTSPGTTGAYFVDFNRSIQGCYHTVSASSANPNTILNGTASSSMAVEDNRVYVATAFVNGAIGDRAFSVMVFCTQ